MNLSDFISAITTRFSSSTTLRTTRSDKGPNVTPIGIVDRGVYNEAEEAATRLQMVSQSHYAESGPTYDPSGKYLCKDCKYRQPTDLDKYNAQCSKVDGLISLVTGSCDYFEYGVYASDDQLLTSDTPMMHGQSKMTKQDAGYQERPTSKAFGCLRCDHGLPAKYKDHNGRRIWCRAFGVHVSNTACCGRHEGQDSRRW